MNSSRATWLAWGLWCVVLALEALTGVFGALSGVVAGGSVATFSIAAVVFVAFASVGALVASRRPGNPVGWLFLAAATLMMIANAAGAYAELALDSSWPGAIALTLSLSQTWLIGLGLLFLMLMLFPDGRPASRRWRPVVVFAAAWLVAIEILFLFRPGSLEDPLASTDNPLGVAWLADVADAVAVTGIVVMTAAALVSLALRFRRTQEQREQVKWLLAAVVVTLVVLVGSSVVDAISTSFNGLPDVVYLAALGLIPAATAVAILKYRLYDIDRIVNRAVVYGLVTGGLAALYFGIVLALEQIFGGLARGNDLAIAGSTLAVAALFRPARRRIQTLVDRRFYRARYDAQKTLAAFSLRLRDEVDLDTLTADLGSMVGETMQPAHLSLWLRNSGDGR